MARKKKTEQEPEIVETVKEEKKTTKKSTKNTTKNEEKIKTVFCR